MINAAALSFCIKKDKNVHINSRLKRKGETDMKAKDIKKFALCLLAALILTGGTALSMTSDGISARLYTLTSPEATSVSVSSSPDKETE